MTYNLPAHGEPDWDTKLNPSLQYVKDTAEAAETPAGAQAKATAAQSAAISAAATDATNKANTAQANAISSAATDATTKANSVQSNLNTHVGNVANPHSVTKAQVGLGNVDNTSDANKPVSTAQQTALNAKQDAAALDTDVAAKVNDTASSTRAALVTLKNAAYDDFTGMADGALPASHLTRSGHGITLFNLGGTDYTLSGGALVHTIGAGVTAAYLGVQVPNQVRRLHAEVKWTDNSQASDELLALIVSGSRFTTAGFADAGAHVLIYRDHWTYQTYQAGVGPTTRDSGTFKALPFGTWNRFALTWDGFQPTLWFPDGTSHVIANNATISAGWGPHATVESYSVGNVNPIAVRAFYASSEVSLPTTATISGAGRHAKTPTTASTSITGSFTVVDTLTITVPQSRLLSVVAYEYVDTGGATGNVYSQVDVGGNGTSTQYQLLSSGVAVNRSMPIIAVLDLGDFTPGTTQTLNIRLLSDATGAIHRLNASEHRRQIIIATPVGAATF